MKRFYVEYDFTESEFGRRPNMIRFFETREEAEAFAATTADGEVGGEEPLKPQVGMGCTECLWTDSHAATITRVSPSGKTIWYRQDNARVVKGSCQDGSAEYEYTFDENGHDKKATLRKDGNYRSTGTNYLIAIGTRREYYDPSF